ncbi:NCS2 family permease [Oceanobacillus sp. J11TS1]|uniref:NCS2 family permease n=1 Tax=Oceanobacillus sp. J11TS1 TaxID=2807191 RepID=UPI001B0BD989|nr:NCS2 family permease [Oceanobacillus sp. J11TS1]GIO21927.1 permease [Oceanobacillus sp. J11TS1]
MKHENEFRKDIVAGIIGYLTTVYIVVVNGTILSEAGISLESGMIATILASFVGTMLMGFFGKMPLILIPGMGINALFAFSIVGNNGFTFHEGLAVVCLAGLLFMITAFTKLSAILKEAIPDSLKHGITTGLGFFLILIGVENSGIITSGEQTVITIGDFTSASVIAGLITLFIAIYLFVKGVPANFLITMIIGTVIAMVLNVPTNGASSVNFRLDELIFIPSFTAIGDIAFWVSVFTLTLILIFENMGTISSQLDMLKQPEAYQKSYRITATSALLSGLFGTSPTISSAENAAVIASGGRTGKAAITAGILFLATTVFIPWISIIPATAISPILIIVGFLMVQNLKHLPWDQFAECIPALLIIVMIPFTYSIGDGMAFGFIAYPIVQLALGQRKKISKPMLLISILFFIDFGLKIIGI